MNVLTAGQLAKKANVKKETIRYYESRGLLNKPPRTESGYRQYSDDTVLRIRFIKRAQELGFSLKEISELLSLRVDKNTTCGDFKNIAEVKISEIADKIHSLNEIKKALMKLVALCSGEGPTGECPIIETLETERKC